MKKNLILEFCTLGTDLSKPFYYYDYNKKLNLIDVSGQQIPYIELSKELFESVVKTNVLGESDDTETVTKIVSESNDYSCSSYDLLTKTSIKAESNDDDIYVLNSELDTKTFVRPEKDQVDEMISCLATITEVKGEAND